MMHNTAWQLDDGWVYASRSRRGSYIIGGCAESGQIHRHATEDEARECYNEWRRRNVRLDSKWSWGSCHVRGCPNPANKGARVEGDGYSLVILCDEHHTLEIAIRELGLNGPAGDSWQS